MKSGKRRILFCESNPDGTVGGSFYSLLFLIEGLDRSLFEPVVVFYFDHALIPRFRRAGADVRVFRRPRPIHLVPRWIGQVLRPVTALLRMLQSALNFLRFFILTGLRYAWFIKRERIDLVHLNNSVVRNADWMLAALVARTPCITHERGINSNFPGLARFFAPRLKAIICISAAVRDNMVRRGILPHNLLVIHNGLDPAELKPSRAFEELRAAIGFSDRHPVIGMVSNIKSWKGQHVVVQALPAIKSACPGVVCLFVGDTAEADRYYEKQLRMMIADLGVEGVVRFQGYQPNVADSLAIVDVAILASTDEPFGRVLLEAMAMRKPVVASRSGAVPEIIVESVTGFTFADGDANDLAARTIELLQNPRRAREMGDAGYQRLVDEFHIRQNVARTLGVYSAVLGMPESH